MAVLLGEYEGPLGVALATGVTAGGLVGGASLLCVWLSYHSRVGPLFAGLEFLLALPGLIAFPTVFLGPVAFCFPKLRRRALRWWVAYALFLACAFPLTRRAGSLDVREAESLTRRLQGLSAAIRSFEERSGRPPLVLNELIPLDLDSLPKPGGALKLQYLRQEPSEGHSDAAWGVIVELPQDLLDFGEKRVLFRSDGSYTSGWRFENGWCYEHWD